MGVSYDHKKIEEKWRKIWEKLDAYSTPDIKERSEKSYVLDMFPYPSGSGLHVGHVEGQVATDIVSRYLRAKGKKVLHPMGFDAFGLPAENYAIKTGIHPRKNTDDAIKTFTEQMKRVGMSFDWKRSFGTHEKSYYKWTQWFFLLLYKNGLAYRKEAPVNWCDGCKTVIANEQVVDEGVCERCGTQVVQKNMKQWFFKITDYADRLIDDLEKLDWPESTKIRQINWIGRSEGVEIDFQIDGHDDKITVFTTRLDTIFGANSLIVSPEHPILAKIVLDEKKKEVEIYQAQSKRKTELERVSLNKEKTGIFTGSYVINPYTKEKIPVWISDFIVMGYGTGAIMSVPAHDKRDFDFAKKFKLPIKKVIDEKKLILVNSGEYTGLSCDDAIEKLVVVAEKGNFGRKKTNYKLRDWLVSRQRYWGSPIPIIYSKDGKEIPVNEADLPVELPDDVEFVPTGRSPLINHKVFHTYDEKKYGDGGYRESDTLDTFVCSSWYFLRFCDPHNEVEFASKESMKKLMPVDVYVGGSEHTVLHLMYARFFTKVLYDQGYIDFDEPFLMLRHPGTILGPDSRKMSKRWNNVINPLDVCNELGADTLRLYEMFMGPFEYSKPWNTSAINGVRRFLENVIKTQDLVVNEEVRELEYDTHYLIKKIEKDILDFSFNTCISEFMKFINKVTKIGKISSKQWEKFLKVLSPFAVYLSEEMWSLYKDLSIDQFSLLDSIHFQNWPVFDQKILNEAKVEIPLQVNGRHRATITTERGATKENIEKIIEKNSIFSRYIKGKKIKKLIYVQDRIVNIVI